MIRVESASNETLVSVIALMYEYLNTQRSFVQPRGQLPASWNLTVNGTQKLDGWTMHISFFGLLTGNSKKAAEARKNAPTTGVPQTAQPDKDDKQSAASPAAGDGSAAAAATRTEDQLLSEALARAVYAACNSKYARPHAFKSRLLKCTGLPYVEFSPGMRLPHLPIPRRARDPTTSTSGPTVIPNWALILGVVAAALLGWALGMLAAFTVCPRLPRISLMERIMADEDEAEQDLVVIFREKIVSCYPCCATTCACCCSSRSSSSSSCSCCCGGGGGNAANNKKNSGKEGFDGAAAAAGGGSPDSGKVVVDIAGRESPPLGGAGGPRRKSSAAAAARRASSAPGGTEMQRPLLNAAEL